jgi:hypothetical protein
MNNSKVRLRPFKELVRDAFKFTKSNAKNLAFLFLPVLLVILVVSVAIDLYGTSLPMFAASVVAIILLLAQIFRCLLVFAGGMMCEDIADAPKHHDPFLWYKKLLKKSHSAILVWILSVCLMTAFAVATVVIGLAIFILPFAVLGLLARWNPEILSILSLQGNSITVGLFILIALGVLVLNVRFALSLWGTPYALFLEGRKGLDALTSSYLFTEGKKWQIFWRLLLISFIAFVPALILLGPVYFFIVMNALKQITLAMLIFQTTPVFPSVSLDLALWRTGFGFVASLVSLPLFVVLNYFLWKDVKAAAPHFDEAVYAKTRKRAKIGAWIGAVILTLCIGVAVTVASFSKEEVNQGALPDFGGIPASGMMQ